MGSRIRAAYEKRLADGRLTPDPSQVPVVEALARREIDLGRKGPLGGLLGGPPEVRGVYLWGPPGRGKSILMEANYGYVKVIAEPKRGRILGAEIVGKDAGELIHAFSAPLAMRATVRDMLRAPWYHPTLAEILTYPLEEIAEKLSR